MVIYARVCEHLNLGHLFHSLKYLVDCQTHLVHVPLCMSILYEVWIIRPSIHRPAPIIALH